MESIAVTKPDMAVLKTGGAGLSPFGMLSALFGQEVLRRSRYGPGSYRPAPLELLEEKTPAPAVRPAPEVKLDLDLTLVIKALKEEQKKERDQDRRETAQAARRVLERVLRREEKLRAQETTRYIILQSGLTAQAGRTDAAGPIRGVQPGAAVHSGLSRGVQPGAVVHSGLSRGVQPGAVVHSGLSRGVQPGAVVYSGPIRGVQSGAAVYSGQVRGMLPVTVVCGGQKNIAVSRVDSVSVSRISHGGLEPVSSCTAAPAAGGWRPRWQQSHPGFAPGGENKKFRQEEAFYSILLPDVLRRRRAEFLQELTEEKNMPPSAAHQTDRWADGGETVHIKELVSRERLAREVSIAVDRALRSQKQRRLDSAHPAGQGREDRSRTEERDVGASAQLTEQRRESRRRTEGQSAGTEDPPAGSRELDLPQNKNEDKRAGEKTEPPALSINAPSQKERESRKEPLVPRSSTAERVQRGSEAEDGVSGVPLTPALEPGVELIFRMEERTGAREVNMPGSEIREVVAPGSGIQERSEEGVYQQKEDDPFADERRMAVPAVDREVDEAGFSAGEVLAHRREDVPLSGGRRPEWADEGPAKQKEAGRSSESTERTAHTWEDRPGQAEERTSSEDYGTTPGRKGAIPRPGGDKPPVRPVGVSRQESFVTRPDRDAAAVQAVQEKEAAAEGSEELIPAAQAFPEHEGSRETVFSEELVYREEEMARPDRAGASGESGGVIRQRQAGSRFDRARASELTVSAERRSLDGSPSAAQAVPIQGSFAEGGEAGDSGQPVSQAIPALPAETRSAGEAHAAQYKLIYQERGADQGKEAVPPAGTRTDGTKPVGIRAAETKTTGAKGTELKAAETKEVEAETVGTKAVEGKEVEAKAAGTKAVEAKTAGTKAVEAKTAGTKAVEAKTDGASAVGAPSALRQEAGAGDSGQPVSQVIPALPAETRSAGEVHAAQCELIYQERGADQGKEAVPPAGTRTDGTKPVGTRAAETKAAGAKGTGLKAAEAGAAETVTAGVRSAGVRSAGTKAAGTQGVGALPAFRQKEGSRESGRTGMPVRAVPVRPGGDTAPIEWQIPLVYGGRNAGTRFLKPERESGLRESPLTAGEPQRIGVTGEMQTLSSREIRNGVAAPLRSPSPEDRGVELSYLNPPPADREDESVKALPPWAQRLMEYPDAAAGQRPGAAISFGQTGRGSEVPPGESREGRFPVPGAGRQIQWSAPGGAVTLPNISYLEPKAAEAVQTGPAPMGERELRRTADKVYRIIEERLRRELRRSGR